MTRMRWTSRHIDDIQDRRVSGQPWSHIATAYGCTIDQVKGAYYAFVHKHGGYLEPHHSWTTDALQELAQQKRDGLTDKQIADMQGLAPQAILDVRRRYGINRHGVMNQ